MLPRRPENGRDKIQGGVAQLGERVNGIHEVRGSIPLASTQRGGGGIGAVAGWLESIGRRR